MQTQVDSSRATAPSAAALLLSFCVGFGTLLSQLAFTRILSFVLWNHLVYLIITMAFCGFALAGTLLAIRPQWLRINHDRVYAVLCGLLSLTLVGGLAVIAYAPLQTPDDMTKLSSLTSFLLINALLILPYFCFGALLSFLLAAFSTAANKVYGVNLLGSALGCLGFVLLLPLTSGPLLVALTAAFFSVVALCFARRRVAEAVFALISTVAAIGFVAVADTVPLKPEPTKTVHHLCGNNGPEFTEWNPLSRVDVVPCGDNLKVIYYDAAAPAFLNRNTLDPHTPPVNYATHNFERQTVPFAFRPKPEHVLVLGVGGARDVVKALQMGARAVTGVEIHDTTYSLLHDRYDDYLNGLAHWPNVKFFHADGRSFVRRYDATYDVVMLVGLDSFAALSSGAYVLYESYIYTRQALQDYFRRLRPGGVIALSRWLFVSKPRESLRLFSTAYEALKAEGIERPLQHLFVSQYESYFAEDRK